jgi:serine/threonine-protein kinase
MGDETPRMKSKCTEQDVFVEALKRETPQARAAYLDGVCEGNSGLRPRVEALLRAAENAGDFLEQPPTGLAGAEADSTTPLN